MYKHTFIMLLQQIKPFTEEQVRKVYPLEQVKAIFAGELIAEGNVYCDFSASLLTNDYFLSEAYFIGTSGAASHTDDEFAQYAYHLVLVNTGLVAKGVNQQNNFEPQVPGTIIVLNNWEWHHAIKDSRIGTSEDPIWVSICFDSDYELTEEQLINIFKEFLND
jgi:hypothetical protein